MHFKGLKIRLNFLTAVLIIPAVIITFKLFYLQVLCYGKFKTKADKTIVTVVKHTNSRGSILDRNSKIIAKSLPTYTCAVSKKYVTNRKKLIKIISRELSVSKEDLETKWTQSGNFFYIAKGVSPFKIQELEKHLRKEKITGVIFNLENRRFYPNGNLTADLLGAVNSKNKGVSGLELLYDAILSSDASLKSQAIKDNRGNLIFDASLEKKDSLLNIHLTIDNRIQHICELFLDKAVSDNRAEGGLIIVQNPKTAEILAAASSPRRSGNSHPFQWTYEPGSTFKVISVSAALDTNTVTPDDIFDCENGLWNFSPSVPITDHEKHGKLTVSEIIELSSNIGTAKISQKMSFADIYNYIRAFGFGTKTPIGFPGESKGMLRPTRRWKPIDAAVMSYGHAIAVTGVQLVSAFSAIANEGNLFEPLLVKKITDTEGRIKYIAEPRLIRKAIKTETAKKIIKMMKSVVETGTAMPAYIKGYTVAGKTGTSRKIDEYGEYTKEKHIASFCGFVPADKPKFTILVVVDQPKTSAYGGVVAAPVFKKIAKRLLALYAIKPDALGRERAKPKNYKIKL